jgi:hypothetical protein
MAISMRMCLGGAAALLLAAGLTGCGSSQKTTASPGVVNGKTGACCSESGKTCTEGEKASPGVMGSAKTGACCKDAAKASPGVMSSEKTSCPGAAKSCASGASSCTK